MGKSTEWLAKRLAVVTRQLNSVAEDLNKSRSECFGIKHLIQENENLGEVLQQSGIRPKRLRVVYCERDCGECDFNSGSYCSSDCFDDEDDCEVKEVTESISFYTYKIDDGYLSGIVSDFSHANYNVISVTDETTGKVFYEYKEEE